MNINWSRVKVLASLAALCISFAVTTVSSVYLWRDAGHAVYANNEAGWAETLAPYKAFGSPQSGTLTITSVPFFDANGNQAEDVSIKPIHGKTFPGSVPIYSGDPLNNGPVTYYVYPYEEADAAPIGYGLFISGQGGYVRPTDVAGPAPSFQANAVQILFWAYVSEAFTAWVGGLVWLFSIIWIAMAVIFTRLRMAQQSVPDGQPADPVSA